MRTATPAALTTDARPALTARVSPSELTRLFPVAFKDIDPLAAAEPTCAALVRLKSGGLVMVEYGLVTSRLTVSVPRGADVGDTLAELLAEAPISFESIEWMAEQPRGMLTAARTESPSK